MKTMLIQPPPDSARTVSVPTETTTPQQQPLKNTTIHTDSHATSTTTINVPHPADTQHKVVVVHPADTPHNASTTITANPATTVIVQPIAVVDTSASDTVLYIPNLLLAPANMSAEYHLGALNEQYNLYFDIPHHNDSATQTATPRYTIIPTPTTWRQSMFTEHELQVKSSAYTPRDIQRPASWLFVLLILLTLSVAIYYRNHRLTFMQLLTAVFSNSESTRVTRECDFTSSSKRLPSTIIYAIASSMIAYCCIRFFAPGHVPEKPFVLFLSILLFVVTTIFLRNILTRLLSSVFLCVNEAANYLLSNSYFQLLTATTLLPILFAIVYMPSLSTMSMIALAAIPALLFLIRIVRGLQIFLTAPKSNHFYLFYYLCTLEIIPIAVLYKMIISM